MAIQIYVGYAGADEQFGKALMAALTATGAQVWHEEHMSNKTSALLGASPIFLLVLSKSALKAPLLRNQALEYATIHNFHPANRLIVVLLEPLASRDLWLFVRHNPQFARDDEASDDVFIQRVVAEVATADDGTVVSDDGLPTLARVVAVAGNGASAGQRLGKNRWRPIFAGTSLLLAFLLVVFIAVWQLWLVPRPALTGAVTTATSVATAAGTTTHPTTITPTPRAITTTHTEATNTPLPTATPRAQATPPPPTAGATADPTASPTPTPPAINFSQGFTNSSNLSFNGGASINGTALQLTDTNTSEARSIFYTNPVSISTFTCHFTFQDTNALADGLTFTLQNNDPSVVGVSGTGLGYTGIGNSVAVKFDLYSTYTTSAYDSVSTIGMYVNGLVPDQPETSLPAGMNFHSGDVFAVGMTYAAGVLNVTTTDVTASGKPSFTQNYPVDIPTTVGASTAYVGFTAGTGSLGATQAILTWSYSVK